jgi:predicted nicotinamide N-methyase
VGLVAHKLGAARVVLTDGDDSALQLMQANVAANVEPKHTTTTAAAAAIAADTATRAHNSTDTATADSSIAAPNVALEQQCQHQNDTVCCCLLQWGNAEQIQQALHHCNCSNSMQADSNTQKFDIVLGGEVIYDGNRADLDSLFQTVLACTHADNSSTTAVFYMAFRQRLVPLDEVRHCHLILTSHTQLLP